MKMPARRRLFRFRHPIRLCKSNPTLYLTPNPNPDMNIKFNKEEAQALFQLIDLAVKSGGLNVAQAAVVLSEKIRQASEVEARQEQIKQPGADQAG